MAISAPPVALEVVDGPFIRALDGVHVAPSWSADGNALVVGERVRVSEVLADGNEVRTTRRYSFAAGGAAGP